MTAPRATARPILWRYHFTDFRSARLLSTLPLLGAKFTDVLSGPAPGEGVVPLSSARVRARDPFGTTIPRRTCLWAERQELDAITGRAVDQRLMWGGVVMGRARDHGSRSMKIVAVSWESYLQRRLLLSQTWTQADKFAIARWIVSNAASQAAMGGPVALPAFSPHLALLDASLGGALSGVLADRTYLASDLKPALEGMKELASSGAGFDWKLVPEFGTPGDLSTMRVRLDLGYPRLGRTAPADLRWSTDKRDVRQQWGYVDALTITEDGSGVHNRVTALGAGTGPDQLRATADSSTTTRDEAGAGYPLYETSLGSSTQDLRTQDAVNGHATGRLLAQLSSETQVSGIKVRGDLAPLVTSYSVGDDATLRLGETVTGTPTTVTGQIIGRTIEPAQQGRTETVTFDIQGAVA